MPHSKSLSIAAVTCLLLLRPTLGQTPPGRQPADAGVPVTLQGHVRFTVRTSLGPFSAADRAAATSRRLLDLAKDLTIPVDAITDARADTSTDILARDRVLLTITEADAQAAQITRGGLASSYVKTI